MPQAKDTPLPAIPTSAPKDGLFKRLTTKIRSTHPSSARPPASSPSVLAAVSKPRRKTTLKLPSLPRPQHPASTSANAFISAEHREAALRARGLVPARYRDRHGNTIPLSEQESQMDQRFSVLVEEREDHEDSEAKKIREAWLRRNAEGEASACEDELAREDLPPVIETALSPRKPKVVREHTPPPLSPSRAEFTTTEAMHLDNVFGMEPTDVPLPESPAGPGSIRSGRSKAVGSPIEADERVSRWLLSTPTASPSKGSTSSLSGHENAAEEDANSLLATPSGKGRKDRPAHISILSVQSSSAPSSPRSQKSVLLPLPNSPPLESEDPRSPRTASVPTLSVSPATPSPHRGRSAATVPIPMTPALSPTRTASSSFTSESPLTPTTLSAPSSTSHAHRMRKSSMTSGESHSSEGPSRQSYVEDQKTRKMEAVDESGVLLMSNVATVILESPVEDEQVADIPTSPLATPLPRTPRPGDREGAGRKKSGLFGKRAADEPRPPPLSRSAHTASSMTNLRRSVTGTISSKLHLRPKSTLVVDTRVANDEQSSLGSPISSTRTMASSASLPIARPRQALSPTMHSRGSILLQAKAVEDDESRRLSELAFLDF